MDWQDIPVHSYYCDCAACWLGLTIIAPKPPTLWMRVMSALRAILSTPSTSGEGKRG